MNRRGVFVIIIAVVGLAGLVAGVLLVLSLSQFNASEQDEPTLAPVAAVDRQPTPSPTAPAESEPIVSSTEVTAAATVPVETQTPDLTSTSTPLTNTVTHTPAAAAGDFIQYTVEEGDTVISIALANGVSVADILAANEDITNEDEIRSGQTLRIPVLPSEVGVVTASTPEPTSAAIGTPTATLPFVPGATATASPAAAGDAGTATGTPPNWPPSVISGDLAGNYPLVRQTGSTSLLLHYQPGTTPAFEIDELAETVDRIYARLQASMNGTVPRQVSVYLGGTLFGVNPSLQGFTQSYEFRSFILVNGAFHRGERDYILGHELTHVTATHILGPASSTMIHEGLATYLPQAYLTDGAGYLPLEQICAAAYHTDAFRSATQLSQLAYGETAFGGHIRTFFNYNLSGCFVQYLLEEFDMAHLDEVYDSGNYVAVYGKTLSELDADWQAELANVPLSVDPQAYVSSVETIAGDYERYINASAGGYHANYQAYLHLNRARLEANRGNLELARQELEQFNVLFNR